jgi:WD40 repeat protein
VLAGRSRIVRRALLTPLDLDPDREIHWGPRSRGVDTDRDDAGWLFSGRRTALTDLTRWLESEGGRPMRVVTGTPGCGKSAVVARLVTTADPHYRTRIPELDIEDPGVPSLGTIDVTFHAGGRTVADFVEHVARVADVDATTDRELLAAFEAEGRPRVIAVDALDESEEAKHLVWLLDDLSNGPTRILVATRPHLVAALNDPEPIVLDEAPYLRPRDIEDYVRLLLSRSGPVVYTDADVEDLVAAADGNFLVAQLTARAIGLTGSVVRPFPREVRRAFDRYLDALPEPEKTRDLLLPLAYGRGDGLPTDLWLAAVACLRKPYARAELDDLLDSPGGSFLVTRSDAAGGGRRHRLFHAVLAETLTARRDRDEDGARLWQAWLDLLHEVDPSGAAWLSAPPYLRTHGADHAAQAGHLPELLDSPFYLLVADLDRLGINLALAPGALALDRHAALLRLAADRSARQGPEARSMTLGLAACHLGLAQTAAELAVAGRPPWIPLWAHDFGHPHERLVGHEHPVSAVALGRLGGQDRIVSGDTGGDLLVWDPETGSHDGVHRPLTVGVHDIRIGRVDRRNVIVAIDANGVTRTWAGTGSELRRRRPEERTLGDIKFSVDRSRSVGLGADRGHEVVVTVAHDGEMRVRRIATGQQVIGVRARRQRRSATVGWFGDDPVVVSGGDGGVTTWKLETPEPDPSRETPMWHSSEAPVTSVLIGRRSGEPVVVGGLDHLSVWDGSGRCLVDGAPLDARCMAVGRVAEHDVVVSASRLEDHRVEVRDLSTGRLIGKLTSDSPTVRSVAVGRIGWRDAVIAGGDSGTVDVWYPMLGAPIGSPLVGHSDRVNAVAAARIGERECVVSGGADGTLQMWDALRGTALGGPMHRTGQVLSVAVGQLPGREIIVSGTSDGSLQVWLPTAGWLGPSQSLGAPVTAVAAGQLASRDVIVAGTDDGLLETWNVTRRRLTGRRIVGEAGPVRSVAIGHIGRLEVVVSGHADGAWLWLRETVAASASAAVSPRSERRLIGLHGPVRAITVGRLGDGDVVLTGSSDGDIQLWDHLTGVALGEPLTGHDGPVNALATGSIAGRDIIVSGGADGTVRIWDARILRCRSVIEVLDAVASVDVYPQLSRIFVGSGQSISAFHANLDLLLDTTWQRQLDTAPSAALGPGRRSLPPGDRW